jgi:hypothetical protein
MTPEPVVLYGDFNCPWSYLASRRARALRSVGLPVELRAVEHDPWRPGQGGSRFDDLREEMDEVCAELLPGEELPYSLAGFVPRTLAAVSAYAEASAADVAPLVGDLLFEAFWLHGLDIGDPKVVRTLLVDAIRSGSSPSEPLRDWGLAVDVTGGPVSTAAWRLIRDWRAQWHGDGNQVVPIVRTPTATIVGVDAVRWLGDQLRERLGEVQGGLQGGQQAGLHGAARDIGPATRARADVAPLSWVSQHGNRWLRAYRRAWQQRTPA